VDRLLDAVGDQGELLVAEFVVRAAPSSFLDYQSCLVVDADLDVVASGVEREHVT
jgi:hypothetical protein